MLQALSRLPEVDVQRKAGSAQWDVVASVPLQEMAQEGIEMDGGVDVDIQRVEAPSASCGVDSWDNQTEEEGNVLDDAGSVRGPAEPYTGRRQVGVGTDMWEAVGRHSGYRRGACDIVSAGSVRVNRKDG
jgi:hypothetical protein